MWNLLALWEDPKTKVAQHVSIITHTLVPDTEVINFIAVDEQGKFIYAYMGQFTSLNKIGFLTGDQPY